MPVKVRVSYTDQKELKEILRILKPVVKSCKAGKGSGDRYKRAYIELDMDKVGQ